MRKFFLLLLIIANSPAIGLEQYQLVERPTWVKHIEVPKHESIPHEQISSGVHYLLVDRQVLVPENEGPSFYVHYADLITNQTGLDQESQINISYDPIYEAVQLHAVVVKRDGVTIDMLQRARVSVLDHEDELDWQIYNGLKKINILLEDIRVGDVLEYSYTITGSNPVFNNVFGTDYRLQWSVPVAHVSLGIFWQKPNRLYSKVSNSHLKLAEKTGHNVSQYWIEARDVEPILPDDDVPSWVTPYAHISLSEQPSWRSVADWGVKLFEPAIKANQSVLETVDDIRASNPDADRRIVESLKFVQSEVRYVGIEFGQNSHQASPASVTLNRRYGDCKDKSVLLISLLRELGIEAFPALVNTEAKQSLVDWLPKNNAFDHVIVAVHHNNKTYWLDPTRQYQAGKLEEVFQPRYGYALVLDQKSDELTPINVENTDTGYFVSDTFDLKSTEFGDVIMTSESAYFGLNAERQRSNLAKDGLNQIRKDYLDYYKGYYPSIAVIDAPRFYEDEKTNRFMLNEKYKIPKFWANNKEESEYSSSVYSNAINWYLNEPDVTTRVQDFRLIYPVNIRHKITLLLDGEEWQLENENNTVINEFFEYKRLATFKPEQGKFILEFSYKSFSDHVPATQFPEYLAQLKRARDDTDYDLAYTYGTIEQEIFLDDWEALVWLVFAVGIPVMLLLWVVEKHRGVDPGEMHYFPVSSAKFLAMWILTWGVYGIYWYYKNWNYVKNAGSKKIMPVWRSLFYQFWYYPLYLRLCGSMEHAGIDDKSRFPSKNAALIMAITFLVVIISSGIDELYAIPLTAISGLIMLPLVRMVNLINADHKSAYDHNSRWRVRHYVYAITTIPLMAVTIGIGAGVLEAG